VQEEKRQPLQQDVLVRAPESAQTELPRDGTKPQDDEPGKILIRAQGLLDGGNLSDAYDAFTRLLALSGEHGQGLETRAYSGFGRVLLRRGELAQAEEQFRAALRIARSLGAKQDIADQLRFIGHVLYLRDDMMRVTSPLLEAERLYEQTGPR
jgi:tetratricopeptide (TPR) repeat protein